MKIMIKLEIDSDPALQSRWPSNILVIIQVII